MKLTVLHPTSHDYVSHLDCRGWYPIREMMSPESVGRLAAFTNRLEASQRARQAAMAKVARRERVA